MDAIKELGRQRRVTSSPMQLFVVFVSNVIDILLNPKLCFASFLLLSLSLESSLFADLPLTASL